MFRNFAVNTTLKVLASASRNSVANFEFKMSSAKHLEQRGVIGTQMGIQLPSYTSVTSTHLWWYLTFHWEHFETNTSFLEGLHQTLPQKFQIFGTKWGFKTQRGIMGPSYGPGTSEIVKFTS